MPSISPKEHYQRLRTRSCAELWREDVAAFDRADARERMQSVAVVRAVGVVFSESGTEEDRITARRWLRSLLHDPEEKVRRYAMTALPKLGADADEESDLLGLLERSDSIREKRSLARTLEKIGGDATIQKATNSRDELLARAAQKAAANLARQQQPGAVRFDAAIAPVPTLRLHFHGRRGLEAVLAKELRDQPLLLEKFSVESVEPGRMTVRPRAAFTLRDIYSLRCFGSVGFLLGVVSTSAEHRQNAEIAKVIASPFSRRLFTMLTDGPIRYRVAFSEEGHQRHAVREIGDHVFAACPDLINDSRGAPWQIDIRKARATLFIELSPRLRPDPRFAYRRGDVPAASHPPLAAAMARLAFPANDGTVWDPFSGSGLELIERARLGSVQRVIGTDLSGTAIETARANFAAAGLSVSATFIEADFRNYATLPELAPGAVSLVITNPPLGRRVPIADLRGLIADLFRAAETVLRPGGALVLVNPLSTPPPSSSLQLDFRQKIDLGGFFGYLEKHRKVSR